MQVGPLGRLHDLLVGGPQLAVGDVVADGAGEEEDVLLYDADVFAQRVAGVLADVPPADLDRAVIQLVEAGQQVAEGGLAAARGAHQGQGFAAADVQVDVPQDLGVVVVGEAHPLKGDVAPGLLVAHGDGAGVVSLLGLVHDLAKALEAGDPLLELLDKGQQPADGV